MTEEAVRRKFDEFIDRMRRYVIEEVQPLNAVGLPSFIGRSTRRATLPVARTEVESVGRSFERKFRIVADCAADGRVEERVDEYLAADVFYANYYGPEERREEMAKELERRLRRMTEAVEPMAESDEDGFWEAVVDAYGRDEAHDVLDGCFDYARTARRYEDGVKLTLNLEIGPLSKNVDYTGEAVRVLEVCEKRLRDEVYEETDDAFDRLRDG